MMTNRTLVKLSRLSKRLEFVVSDNGIEHDRSSTTEGYSHWITIGRVRVLAEDLRDIIAAIVLKEDE